MPRKNAIIELLKLHPRVKDKLPYRITTKSMSMENRQSIRKLQISGGKGQRLKRTRFYLARTALCGGITHRNEIPQQMHPEIATVKTVASALSFRAPYAPYAFCESG